MEPARSKTLLFQKLGSALSIFGLLLGAVCAEAAPVITDVSPTAGAPGTSVAIGGAGLGNVQTVQFGTIPALFTIASDNLLFATVPLNAITAPLAVTSPSGLAVTRGEFLVPPRITGFEPNRAPIGAVILVDGFNFEGTSAVLFNGTNAAFSVTSPTQIQTIVPVGATSGPVSIITGFGATESPFSFTVSGQDPFVTRFSPGQGKPGDRVVIDGVNFAGLSVVTFGGTKAAFNVTSSSQVTATVPNGAPSGPIEVGNNFGTNLSAASFVVTSAPVITDFQPIGGGPGTPVVINGANFLGATDVRIGGVSAKPFAVTAASQLHATVGTGATNGLITITTPSGTGASTLPFLATSDPIVFDFAPTNGPPGTILVLDGLNFGNVVSVTLGGVPAKASATAPTQLLVTAPAGATNGLIVLKSASGATTSTGPFLVQTGKPIITALDPDAGPTKTVVRIDGLDFTGVTAVKFNGSPASFQAVAPTQINAVVPDNATSGAVTVVGQFGSGASAVPFVVAPTLTGFAPASGIAGTAVTIQGSNLGDVTVVRFNEVVAQFSRPSTNQVVAVVPDEAISGSINLISPAGIIATTNWFLVTPRVARFSPTVGQPGTEVNIFGTGFSDVSRVAFGDVPVSGFTILSATQMVTVVPPQAKTGPISVTTIGGTGTSTRSFTVGTAADLALLATQSTNALLQNQVWSYGLTITNQGPSAASAIVLTNFYPPSLMIASASAPQGVLTRTDSMLRLELGTLASGASASLTVSGIIGAAGSFTNSALVSAREQDPDTSNNTVRQVIIAGTNPAVLRITDTSPGMIRVSWPTAATNFVLQAAAPLTSPVTWQNVPGTPQVIANEYVMFLPTTGPGRYLRLVRP